MNKVDVVEQSRMRKDIPPFRPGDQVKVHVKVTEGQRQRIQVFEGVVLARRGGGLRESFTVRKISFGVGVERTFPIHGPGIDKVEIVRHGKVRRAKLYYLRERIGRRAKIDERRTRIQQWEPGAEEAVAPEPAPDEPAADEAAPEEAAPEAAAPEEAAPAQPVDGAAPDAPDDAVAPEATSAQEPSTDEVAPPEPATPQTPPSETPPSETPPSESPEVAAEGTEEDTKQ